MIKINRNTPASKEEILFFLEEIDFKLPNGFIDFFEESNGAEIFNEVDYCVVWPITEMVQLNIDYDVLEYAKEFFIFGSDGGGNAFTIERETGNIFKMPFIGMCKEEAVFISESFDDFLKKI